MELKDVILSTLAEIEELTHAPETQEEIPVHSVTQTVPEEVTVSEKQDDSLRPAHQEEIRMLEGIRERLLVLFEGFQSPNNVRIEAKVDLTLNFLEYLLATIDSRLETIKE